VARHQASERKGEPMKRIAIVVALIAVATLVAAQDEGSAPPASMGGRVSTLAAVTSEDRTVPNSIPFCPTKSCLYYAGDFDSSYSGANAVCDFNNGVSDCALWVAVKPSKAARVTGVNFNVFNSTSSVGVNPTPVTFLKNVIAGVGGSPICTKTTGGNAIMKLYQSGISPIYSYYVRKLNVACSLPKGKLAWVNLQPTYSDGETWGYVPDIPITGVKNHIGWRTVYDDSYVNYDGLKWVETHNGVCGGLGCDAFSVALNGTQK